MHRQREGVRPGRGRHDGSRRIQHPGDDHVHPLARPWRADEQDGVLDGAPQVAPSHGAKAVADIGWPRPTAGSARADDVRASQQRATSGSGLRLGGCGQPGEQPHIVPGRSAAAHPSAPPAHHDDDRREQRQDDEDRGAPVRDGTGQLLRRRPRRGRVAPEPDGAESLEGPAVGHGSPGHQAPDGCPAPQDGAHPEHRSPGGQRQRRQVRGDPGSGTASTAHGPPCPRAHPATGPSCWVPAAGGSTPRPHELRPGPMSSRSGSTLPR